MRLRMRQRNSNCTRIVTCSCEQMKMAAGSSVAHNLSGDVFTVQRKSEIGISSRSLLSNPGRPFNTYL